MARPSQNSMRRPLNTLLGKGRRLFSTVSTPSNLQFGSHATMLLKQFKKSKDARHDISVLAMTYILEDNPIIRKVICLIIDLNDRDDGSLSEILTLCAIFTVELASFQEKDSSKALTAITAFQKTMQEVDTMVRGGNEITDNVNDMINTSITHIKNTHPALSDRDRKVGTDKGLSGVLDTIIGSTSTVLKVFNEASALIPVPFVKPLVASVACLLAAVQQTRSNHDDMRQIATVAGEFVVFLAVACAGDELKPSRPFQQALDRFEDKLHDIAQKCSELSRRNVLWRFLQQGVDQGSLSAVKEDLANAVRQFQTQGQLLQHLDLRSLGQVINEKLDVDAVGALPKLQSYVGRRDEYLPGSRNDAIQVISDWLESSNQLTFWMRGGAGLGKSTLAHELVDSLRADGRLATFAFLLRGSSSDPATIIQAMARELGALHLRSIPQVAAAARTCQGSHRFIHEYMESYIINPICSLSYSYPLVIIIDGLDEWEHHEMFLKDLEYIPPSSPIKILLISRPNHSIERSLLKVATQKYELPPVSQAITEQYFNHHFAKIDWEMRKPSSFTISNLARLADGLLIWAAMVCSFLSHEMRPCAPHELVDQILSSGKQIALEDQLSNLYRDALKHLFRGEKDQKLFRQVFGAMTILQESLPLHDFARLLGIPYHQVKGVQSKLTALQTRGTFDGHTVSAASRCFHSSFIEFTMNEETEAETGSPIIPYLINPQSTHESIAEGCLSFLNNFLSSFKGRECSHSDLRGAELYAVKFWPLHVANANDRLTPLPPKLRNLLLELAENHLRQWGSWFLAINLPTSSQDWIQVVGDIDKDEFFCSIADFLKNNMATDSTLASHRSFCLEIAVRLEPNREDAWEALGDAYRTRFESTYTLDLLNNAIIAYRHALGLYSNDGRHLTCMSQLGFALCLRFESTGFMTDLEEAIHMLRESLSLRPALHPDRASSLHNLANAFFSRFSRTGSMTDLDDAILMYRESLSLLPSPHPMRPWIFSHLANALGMRFENLGLMTDLEEAILMCRESLSLCPTSHPGRAFSLTNLATALVERFRTSGSTADLEEAILTSRESLSLCPTSHLARAFPLDNLAAALHSRFGKTGSMADLDDSILMHRESLSLRPTPHPYRVFSLRNLANALLDRFGQTDSMADLDEAILLHRESLSLLSSPHPDCAFSINALANALGDRFGKTGSMADIDAAILMYRELLYLCPIPHPLRSCQTLSNLAHALQSRFSTAGSMTDLEEAILMWRESLSLCPATCQSRAFSLTSLANGLLDRFGETGSMTDLDDAVVIRRESLSLCPMPHPHRASALCDLAAALQTRFGNTGSITDLEEAISMSRALLADCPAPHPIRLLALSYPAYALEARFNVNGVQSDLDEASFLRQEVQKRITDSDATSNFPRSDDHDIDTRIY